MKKKPWIEIPKLAKHARMWVITFFDGQTACVRHLYCPFTEIDSELKRRHKGFKSREIISIKIENL